MRAVLNTVAVTIPAGESLSNAADCSGATRIARIIVPDEWNGAPLSFQMSADGVTYHDLYHVDPNSFYAYEAIVPRVRAGAMVTLPPGLGTDIAFVKVRSGTHGTPIVQDIDQAFTFVLEL
jgi:hypothetical protein